MHFQFLFPLDVWGSQVFAVPFFMWKYEYKILHSLRRRKQPKQVDDLEEVELIVLKRSWCEVILIAEELQLSTWMRKRRFGGLWRWLVYVIAVLG